MVSVVAGLQLLILLAQASPCALRICSPMLMGSTKWSHLDFAFISLSECKPPAALQQRCRSALNQPHCQEQVWELDGSVAAAVSSTAQTRVDNLGFFSPREGWEVCLCLCVFV